LKEKRIEDYASIVGQDEVEAILELAERVRGAKVVHVNATRYGGGVAEILKNLIPLANSVGLKAKWEVLEADCFFFQVTKTIHNALQGDLNVKLTPEMFEYYLEVNKRNAGRLDLDGEVTIIHDPQPLPLIEYRRNGRWVWRCHIDMSEPNPTLWRKLKPFVEKFDVAVFSLEKYIPRDLSGMRFLVNYPSIDPLSEKNIPLSATQIAEVLAKYEVNAERPIIGQVARFDRWKNPLGVIDVYRKVKEHIPGVQLLLIGSFAHDDPEGFEWYRKTLDYAGSDPNIHVLTNHDGVGDLEVNAFQRAFTVALQLSIKEGFGLAVTEALWKCVPVVATRAGGIPLQVIDGLTGYLVDGLEEAVERVVKLIRMPWLARTLGRNGVEHVKNNFLITKSFKNYLRMHIDLVGR